MSEIKEVNVLDDFRLTLDHFYSIVKTHVGNLYSGQYIQLQATAIPLDVSEEYEWFSLGNLNAFFDIRIDPLPVADNVTLLAGAKLSGEYRLFMADLLSLVEYRELDADTLKRIDALHTKVMNNGSKINALLRIRMQDWVTYADASMLDKGNVAIFTHWAQDHYTTQEIVYLYEEQGRDQALMDALRLRKYSNPDHQAVVDAYAAVTSAASRMRYPRFEDKLYGDEAKKFNVVYFASLPDNESSLFANRQLMTPRSTLGDIATGSLGAFNDTVSRQSSASSKITTDWSASGGGGWGPVRFSASVSSHQQIKDEFAATQSIGVGAKSLQAIPIDAGGWFRPEMFKHPLVLSNRRLFERYLGEKGSLKYYPTHLIFARGFNLTFASAQAWQYDFESDFSAKGSASAKVFGVGWGGGGSYSQSKREQKVEKRGHDLKFDDGENLRILGYLLTKNESFGEMLLSDTETAKHFQPLFGEKKSASANDETDGTGAEERVREDA